MLLYHPILSYMYKQTSDSGQVRFFVLLLTKTAWRSITLPNKRGQYPAILTKQTWSWFITSVCGFLGNFPCWTRQIVPGYPRGLHLAPSGNQAQHRIWFILPTHGPSQIRNSFITMQSVFAVLPSFPSYMYHLNMQSVSPFLFFLSCLPVHNVHELINVFPPSTGSKSFVRFSWYHLWSLPCSFLDVFRSHTDWQGCYKDASSGRRAVVTWIKFNYLTFNFWTLLSHFGQISVKNFGHSWSKFYAFKHELLLNSICENDTCSFTAS